MDPLQPLPRRPKPAAMGAWILAGLLLPLAVLVLWLNIRPKGMKLQTRVEQGRDGILRLLQLGPEEPQTDPAIQQAPAPLPADQGRAGPAEPAPAGDAAREAPGNGATGKNVHKGKKAKKIAE